MPIPTVEPIINDGALPGRNPSGRDYVAGEQVSAVPFELRQPSADWYLLMPPGEWQRSSRADSMSCVTFSALNSIEGQERQLTGRQVNYSDRWIARMSGTTREGNYLWKVAETIRQFGLVLESDYPAPGSAYTWDEYHANIPEPLLSQLKAKGQEWLKRWTIAFEWVPVTADSFRYHLKHAPIQVVFPYHAVVNVKSPQDIATFFDTYEPFFKDKAINQFTDALKIVLIPKDQPLMAQNQTKVVLSKDGRTVYLATPVATDFENFKKQASVEGIIVPDPIPPSSSL